MKKSNTHSLLLLCTFSLLLLTGCTSEPFKHQTLIPMGVTAPQQILDKLARSMPTSIVTDDTVVIQAPFRDDLAVLSVVKIDRINVTLELMGMSHTGVKLFHVAYVDGQPLIRFAAPPLAKQTQVLESLATDSWHIYFDLLPELDSWKKTSWDNMTFERKTSNGKLTYTVARIAKTKDVAPATVLTEKQLSTWTGTKWRIRYFQYEPPTQSQVEDGNISTPAVNAKRHPTGIVLDNKKFHYRIIVKNRQWQEVSP